MNLEERVKQIIGAILKIDVANIRLEASLKDDLGATSLDRYTILMEVEEAFKLNLDDIPEDELEEKMITIADIVAFLRKRVEE
jgi:acyl carrier protein